MASNPNLNLKRTSRNPSSIANDQHNDASGTSRSANGDVHAIQRIIPSAEHTAATGADVPERGTLRVANTTTAWHYVSITDHDAVPGTVDITTGMAIAPNSSSMIFTGLSSSEMKSLKLRTSNSAVQVIIMQP
jgi:hypothetical protein